MTSNTTRTKRRRKNKDRPNKENLKKETKRITKNLEILEKLMTS
ncbi:MAG: hypothetical protein WHS38_04885 [Thermodesulforhabdaceae bacterium]